MKKYVFIFTCFVGLWLLLLVVMYVFLESLLLPGEVLLAFGLQPLLFAAMLGAVWIVYDLWDIGHEPIWLKVIHSFLLLFFLPFYGPVYWYMKFRNSEKRVIVFKSQKF